ncbi:PTS sugar transporter subunit IIC [Spiroplasma endosymbiont of Panorpa germanica]|uniref:PTS sugar transporter subunit IIC n=1 Tax=Spiroplasma endosymbiont of Panorpa germanica TaxID=3066314 RepID=UPI0030D5AC03
MAEVEKFDVQKVRKKEKRTFKQWISESLVPGMAKVGNQRHLAAIRDSFGTMIPLIIAGSIGILINAIIFGGAGSGYVSLLGLICKAANPSVSWDGVTELLGDISNGWGQASKIGGLAFGHINTVTVGMMAIYFAFLFGYFIALSRNFKSPIIAGFVSLSAFLLACMGEVTFFMGAVGLIQAILFGLLATEFFIYLSGVRALNIKLPDGVPPAVGKSFAVFLPVVITLGTVGAVNIIFLSMAIVGGGWFVNSGSYFTLTSKQFGEMFGTIDGNNIDALFADKGALQAFVEYKELLTPMLQILALENSLENQKAFVDTYNALGAADQAVWTTAIATLQGHSNFAWLNEAAKMSFYLDSANGGYILSASFQTIVLGPTQFGAGAFIYKIFTAAFIGFATGSGGIGLAIAFVFFTGFFWFFGVHGSNLMAGIFEPIWWMILGINAALVTSMGYQMAADSGQMGAFTKPFFDSYMYVGGSGATLGLLIMTFAVSKRQELREVAKYALPAGVFQINEPTIFGYPLILNPIYVAPFIFSPIVNLIIGWLFSPDVLGIVKYSYVATPWTSPWIFGAVLTSIDAMAIIPATICLGVSIIFYFPFVLIDNANYFKKLKAANIEQYNQEMRYYNDPEYRYGVITERKVSGNELKAENALNDAATVNEFWEKRMVNKEKLALAIESNNKKAKAKEEKYLQKAQEIKATRDSKVEKYKPKWDKYMEKQAAKAETKSKALEAKAQKV